MKTPAEVYTASPRAFAGLPELAYPLHDRDAVVAPSGAIRLHGRSVRISSVLAGQRLGLREVENDVWLVSFSNCLEAWARKRARPMGRAAAVAATRCAQLRARFVGGQAHVRA